MESHSQLSSPEGPYTARDLFSYDIEFPHLGGNAVKLLRFQLNLRIRILGDAKHIALSNDAEDTIYDPPQHRGRMTAEKDAEFIALLSWLRHSADVATRSVHELPASKHRPHYFVYLADTPGENL